MLSFQVKFSLKVGADGWTDGQMDRRSKGKQCAPPHLSMYGEKCCVLIQTGHKSSLSAQKYKFVGQFFYVH